MLDRIYPVGYLSASAQLALSDATRNSVGILLTPWCSPPHPKLPANSRPVCYRQETDFCLRAGRVSEEAQLVLGHPPRHNLPLTLPATAPEGSVTQLSCTSRLPETALAQREDIHVARGRSLCAVLPGGAPGQTAADSEVPSRQPLASPTAPQQGRALGNPVALFIEPPSPFSLHSQAEDDNVQF